jgi:predicted short-subunit dehydrogenase-like oxidoreductase (DUF2520 family)
MRGAFIYRLWVALTWHERYDSRGAPESVTGESNMAVTFAVVGPGRAGRALAAELQRSGWRLVGVLGRNPRRTAQAAAQLQPEGQAQLLTEWSAIRRAAQVVFLATPDAQLARVAHELASDQDREGSIHGAGPVVLHLSGATPSTVLAPLRDLGCAVGALHPLQTLADPGATLRGITWGVEGDVEAVAWADRVVQLLNGTALPVEAAAKPLYHAAAAVASNYLAVLIDLAAELLAAAGIPRQQGVRALLPLIQGAVANVQRLGLPAALTGPVERGDLPTVQTHLVAFSDYGVRPQLVALYRLLGIEAVRLALEKGSIDRDTARVLAECLTGHGSET